MQVMISKYKIRELLEDCFQLVSMAKLDIETRQPDEFREELEPLFINIQEIEKKLNVIISKKNNAFRVLISF